MTDKWVRDTGLVFALVFLLLGFLANNSYLLISIALLVAVLFVPKALTPLAWVWLKIAEFLGKIMNKVFFGLVFFLIVTPMGLLKRIVKGDERDLSAQPTRKSAFFDRDHLVEGSDLVKPF